MNSRYDLPVIRKSIGKRLKKYIVLSNFNSIEDMANKCLVPETVINQYLEGKQIMKFEEMERICNVLNTNLLRLIVG